MSKRRRPFVAVETDVVKDESFAVLGDVCGYNRDEALGRVFRMWAWCADRKLRDAPDGCPGYAVPEGVVVRFLGPDGVRGILGGGVAEFALGERWGGLIYLRGTDATVAARRSKINGAIAGGEARGRESVATGGRGSDGRFVSDIANTPADDPAGSSVDPRSQIPDPTEDLPPPRDPGAPSPVPEHTLRSSPPPAPKGEARQIWQELELARAEAGRELGIAVIPLPVGSPGERDLQDLFAAARISGADAIDRLMIQCRQAIVSGKAETVSGEKSPEWFTGSVFSGRNFSRLVAKQPGSRAGPRSSAERAQPRIRPKVVDEIPPD